MKPWERALQRDPMCAFVEAVVDKFSPIDAVMCHFARIAQTMRDSLFWSAPGLTWPWAPGPERGSVHWYVRGQMRGLQTDEVAGTIPREPDDDN